MTYNELKREVAQLGFERDVEDEESLLISANRAQDMIFCDRPVKKKNTVYCAPSGISVISPVIHHAPKEELEIKISAAACSFCVSGKGSYTLKTRTSRSRYDFCSNMEECRHLLQGGEGTVTFCGNFDYDVLNLAAVSVITSESEDDIPIYNSFREIDITSGKNDFKALVKLPRDDLGKTVKDCRIDGQFLYVPQDFSGYINLEYYRSARKIVGYDNESIDIPPDAQFLLPLLTASFMWLDDDAAKAQYYLALYNDALANLTRRSRSTLDSGYETNGWA